MSAPKKRRARRTPVVCGHFQSSWCKVIGGGEPAAWVRYCHNPRCRIAVESRPLTPTPPTGGGERTRRTA